MVKGLALLVGLKSVDPAVYGDDGAAGSRGCEHDADNMAKIVSGAGKYEIKTLKTRQATASAILAEIQSAADTLNSGDLFVFFYSGHGGRIADASGDEADQYDETLVAYDRQILDDELAALWLKFAPGVRIVMLSDSCNSGTNDGFDVMRAIKKPRKPINFAEKVPGLKAQLIHYGACRDGGASAGYMQGSAFTLALCEVWGKHKFSGTYPQLHEAIKECLIRHREPQEPQFNFFGDVQPAFLDSRPFSLS